MAATRRMFLHFMHAHDQRARPGPHLPLRHAAHQRHAARCAPRSRRGARQGARTAVEDWSGGTRIGTCAARVQPQWSRRVLGQGAVVLLITDGLDRDGDDRAGARDGAAAPILPPADLAQPAVALRGLRAKAHGHPGDAAPCRRVPAGAQSRLDGRPVPALSAEAACDADPRRWLAQARLSPDASLLGCRVAA